MKPPASGAVNGKRDELTHRPDCIVRIHPQPVGMERSAQWVIKQRNRLFAVWVVLFTPPLLLVVTQSEIYGAALTYLAPAFIILTIGAAWRYRYLSEFWKSKRIQWCLSVVLACICAAFFACAFCIILNAVSAHEVISVEGTVVQRSKSSGRGGMSYRLTMQTSDKSQITWPTSQSSYETSSEGSKVVLTARRGGLGFLYVWRWDELRSRK